MVEWRSVVWGAAGVCLFAGVATTQGWTALVSREAVQATREAPRAPLVAGRFRFDKLRRLVADSEKREIACPQQSERTAVLLLVGQSNAANHGGQRQAATHAAAVINFHAGRCYAAVSPLLGASGHGGEHWSLLGDMLISSGTYDRVILIPAAVTATRVARWAKGGDLDPAPLVRDVAAHGYHITHVLWHQGEADAEHATKADDYRRLFNSMVESLRSAGVDAPVLVSVSTRCDLNGRPFRFDNPVAETLRTLPDRRRGVHPGVDSDRLLDSLDRFDSCHFAGSGQLKVAAEWQRAIELARQ